MNNAIVTHNHPMNDNFSRNDVKEFVNSNLYEIRASTNKNVYSLKKGVGQQNKNIVADFEKADIKSVSYASNKIGEKIKNKTLGYIPRENPRQYNLDRQLYQAEYKDRWLRKNAEKYGYVYSKSKL